MTENLLLSRTGSMIPDAEPGRARGTLDLEQFSVDTLPGSGEDHSFLTTVVFQHEEQPCRRQRKKHTQIHTHIPAHPPGPTHADTHTLPSFLFSTLSR